MKKQGFLLALILLLALPLVGGAASTLSYGSVGEDVTAVQERLAQLGYYTGVISGNYLENTQSAVRTFQRQNGLKVDGVVGQDSWNVLFSDPDVADAYSAARPEWTPAPAPYQIGVDVTNQVVTIYELSENGTYSRAIKHMLCSTGTEKDPTPPGSYTLNGATSRWCYFPKWGTHAQYWTRIDAYNAFHSVIYSQADSMALSVSSYTGLGKRASHGCIRLMLEDAKWIYENCGKGTEVVVYEGVYDDELTKSLKIPPLDESVMLPYPTPLPTLQPIYDPSLEILMPSGTLEYGMEGGAVYWMQCRLAELGYYGGSLTGGYYAGTKAAVEAFQRDHGLMADGRAGEETIQRMYADYLVPATPAPTPAPTPVATEPPWFTPRERSWAN